MNDLFAQTNDLRRFYSGTSAGPGQCFILYMCEHICIYIHGSHLLHGDVEIDKLAALGPANRHLQILTTWKIFIALHEQFSKVFQMD